MGLPPEIRGELLELIKNPSIEESSNPASEMYQIAFEKIRHRRHIMSAEDFVDDCGD